MKNTQAEVIKKGKKNGMYRKNERMADNTQ
jgi:hypothetical protein